MAVEMKSSGDNRIKSEVDEPSESKAVERLHGDCLTTFSSLSEPYAGERLWSDCLTKCSQTSESCAAEKLQNDYLTRSSQHSESNAKGKLQGLMHVIVRAKNALRCKVCSTPQNVKRTVYICEGCEGRPRLHPQCFKIWHTKYADKI